MDVQEPVVKRKKAVEDIQPVNSATAKKVKIVIPKTKDETADVFVAVNGTGYLIKRGEHVEVPDYIVGALQNAVEDRLDQETKEIVATPSYSFSIVG